MKSRINLYRKEFKPKFVWLSITNTLFLSGLVLLVLAGIYYSAWLANEKRQNSLSELKASMTERQERLDALTLQLSQRTKNPVLLNQLAQRQSVLESSTRLAEKLKVLEQNQDKPFSSAFQSFSQANNANVWLTHFYLSPTAQRVEGNILRAETLPAWLQRLGRTAYFNNSDFETATITTVDEQLSFVIQNGDVEAENGGSE